MKTRGWWCLAVGSLVWVCAGCVHVKAPERISIGESRPEPVDSSRVPHPATLEAAQEELNKAYQNIQYLERENRELRAKADKYKRERDGYKDRLKRYEKD